MKQSNTQTAAIYCRVAVKDDLAIDLQQQSLKQFSNEIGYVKYVCYKDNGTTGMTLNGSTKCQSGLRKNNEKWQ